MRVRIVELFNLYLFTVVIVLIGFGWMLPLSALLYVTGLWLGIVTVGVVLYNVYSCLVTS